MRALVAGCGYVGTELGLRLASAGHEVWGLRRSPADLPLPIRPLAADLDVPATLEQLPADLDAVVYAVSADASEPRAYRAAYITGLENLETALKRNRGPDSRVPRLVFISSTAVYGERRGGMVDESTMPDPEGFRGEILLEAERVARQWVGETVVVRASGIYGPGRDRMIGKAAGGRLEGEDRWTNRIHRDDLAEAVRHVLDQASPSALYLASDQEPARLSEVLKWLAAEIGVPWSNSATEDTSGDVSSDMAEVPDLPGKRCVPGRLLDDGFSFHFPTWREGYRSLIGRSSRSRPSARHIPDRPDAMQLDPEDGGRVVSR